MKNFVFITFIIFITACNSDEKLSADFFYNTGQAHESKLCGNSDKQWTWSFKLDSANAIFACYQNNLDTRFTITNSDFTEVLNDLHFPNARLYPWILTYGNNTIIAVKENYLNKQNKELVSINLSTEEIKTLTVLPYNTYRFSEHPISENGILIFNANINNVHIFNLNSEKLNNEVLKSQNSPIISKDGKNALFVLNEDVFLYTIATNSRKMVYSTKEKGNYKVFNAFFGNKNEIIVKCIKNPEIKPLQQVEYLVIENNDILEKGQIDFKKGYRYH